MDNERIKQMANSSNFMGGVEKWARDREKFKASVSAIKAIETESKAEPSTELVVAKQVEVPVKTPDKTLANNKHMMQEFLDKIRKKDAQQEVKSEKEGDARNLAISEQG